MKYRPTIFRAPAKAGAQGSGHNACGPGLLLSAEQGTHRSTVNGFTLIEIMVALAVFSLAALALIRLEGATIRGATILDSTLTAQLVARNVAIEAVTDARPPTIGDTSGTETTGGRSWQWTRHVEPTGDARSLRIDGTVADSAGVRQGRITMVRASAPVALPTGASS